MKVQELLDAGLSRDEVAFLLEHQDRAVQLQAVPTGLVEKARVAGLNFRLIYTTLCDGCGELNQFAVAVRSFTCDMCGALNDGIRPTGRLELGLLVSEEELVESVRDLLVCGPVPSESVTICGSELLASGQRFRIHMGDFGMREVFDVLTRDAFPITIIISGRVLDEVRTPSLRFATELRIVEVRSLLDCPERNDLMREVLQEPPADQGLQLPGLEGQSAILRRGYAALFPVTGVKQMVDEMGEYLAGTLKRNPRLFGIEMAPADFCEYWVHFWFKILGLFAYKLGAVGKETGLGNPAWADGLVFLPKNRDIRELTTYLYDVTIGTDYEHELEQAAGYIHTYGDALRGRIDFYYVITKQEIGSRKADRLHQSWLMRRQELAIRTEVVFLSLHAMHHVLAKLQGLPNFWEPAFFLELDGLLGRSNDLVQRGARPMVLPDQVVQEWTSLMCERATLGDLGNMQEYEKLVRYYSRYLLRKLPDAS